MSPEVAGEVGLVVEPDHGSRLRDRFAIQKSLTSGLDTTRDQIAVRADSVATPKRAHKPWGCGTQGLSRVGQGHCLEEVRVEQCPQRTGELLVAVGNSLRLPTVSEMMSNPLHHDTDGSLRGEGFVGMLEQHVQLSDVPQQEGIVDVGVVNGTPSQVWTE
jgi:hypothetical protein